MDHNVYASVYGSFYAAIQTIGGKSPLRNMPNIWYTSRIITTGGTFKSYSGVAEFSIYIKQTEKGKGIGDILLRSLNEKSESQGFWTLQAGIFPSPNRIAAGRE